jgi:hypothetical protein
MILAHVVRIKTADAQMHLMALMHLTPWSFPEAPLRRFSPRRFEEHEDSCNRTLEITKTVGFVELRALRVLRGENSHLLQEKTMEPAAQRDEYRYVKSSFLIYILHEMGVIGGVGC